VEELSSEGNDLRPSIRFDGKEIFLSSDRAGSTDGSQDLWVSTRPNQGTPWSRPENLGPVVNTGFAEQQPGISDDATMLFFASDRPGGSGDVDLWVTTRTRRLF
jgi:Tol biopolymer transport system component